jgi:hypothetical protein
MGGDPILSTRDSFIIVEADPVSITMFNSIPFTLPGMCVMVPVLAEGGPFALQLEGAIFTPTSRTRASLRLGVCANALGATGYDETLYRELHIALIAHGLAFGEVFKRSFTVFT